MEVYHAIIIAAIIIAIALIAIVVVLKKNCGNSTNEEPTSEINEEPVATVTTTTYPNGGQHVSLTAVKNELTEEEIEQLKAFREKKSEEEDKARLVELQRKIDEEQYMPTEEEIEQLKDQKESIEELEFALRIKEILDDYEITKYKQPLFDMVDEIVDKKFKEEKEAEELAKLEEGKKIICKEIHASKTKE